MKNKIKILQVISTLAMGGAETVAYNLYKYSDKDKFEISYLVFNGRGEFFDKAKKAGVDVTICKAPSELGYIKLFKELVKIFKKNGSYDVIHAHNFTNNGIVLLAARCANISVRISHSHTTLYKDRNLIKLVYSTYMKLLIRSCATLFIACGDSAGNSLYGHRFFRKHGVVLKNGIDIMKYRYSLSDRNKLRKDLGVGIDEIVIIQVGRLSREKNQKYSIDVFSELLGRGVKAKLFLVGDGDDKVKLKQQASSMCDKNDVLILGTRFDVPLLLQAADVFIMPSYFEGLPLALVEAQAASLPCLISDSIADEAVISNLVHKLSINDSPTIWADYMQKLDFSRRDDKTVIDMDEYDVNVAIPEFEAKYYVKK